MGAPLGNKFAKGNKGGSRKSAIDEFKICKLKNICVDFAINEMENPKISNNIKRIIVLKVLGLLPREMDITSGGEKIMGIKYIPPNGDNNDKTIS